MKEVNEKSTAWVEFSFFDRDGEPTTPSSIQYTIYDRKTEQVVSPTEQITPQEIVEITLTHNDNIIINQENEKEVRVILLIVFFGAGNRHKVEYEYQVNNLQFVN